MFAFGSVARVSLFCVRLTLHLHIISHVTHHHGLVLFLEGGYLKMVGLAWHDFNKSKLVFQSNMIKQVQYGSIVKNVLIIILNL